MPLLPTNVYDGRPGRIDETNDAYGQINAATAAIAALPGTYGAIAGSKRRNLIVLVGDSITNQNTDYNESAAGQYWYSNRGYFSWANVLLRHRFALAGPSATDGEYGAGGLTTTSLVASGDVTLAAAADADWAIVHIGTNDITAGGTTAAAIAARILAIWQTLTASGKRVIATTILPRNFAGDTGAMWQMVRDTNRIIRANAVITQGVILCDWYGALLDATTGLIGTTYTADGIHPNAIGAGRLGKVLADLLTPIVPTFEDLGQDNTDTLDVLTNGLMTGTTGTKTGAQVSGTVATGWTVTQTGTPTSVVCSKVARTDVFPGEWQQVVCTAAAVTDGCDLTGQNLNVGTDWQIGETYYASVEFETDAAGWDARGFFANLVVLTTTAQANDMYSNSSERAAMTAALYRPTSGVLRTPSILVPSGATRLQLRLWHYGSGTYRYGRAQLCKVQ
jgi:lysophospholipase L1-like esterase